MLIRSSDRKIARAIDAAPILAPNDDMGELRGPDGFGEFAGPPPEDSTITVANEQDLRRLIARTTKLIKANLSDAYMDRMVGHEREHADAAKVVGALATQYGVRFYRISDPEDPSNHTIDFEPFTEHRFGRRTSALELAAVLAYPIEPSYGDVADVQGLGFSGVEEVGRLTAELNARYGFTVPVPKSFSPSPEEFAMYAAMEPTTLYARGPGTDF